MVLIFKGRGLFAVALGKLTAFSLDMFASMLT